MSPVQGCPVFGEVSNGWVSRLQTGARGTGTGHAAPPALKQDPGLGCDPDARPEAGLQTGCSSSPAGS